MKRRAGYMLLEVVLAMSIFIVAVVGLIRCLCAGLDADDGDDEAVDVCQVIDLHTRAVIVAGAV